jgi:hypothetical protein
MSAAELITALNSESGFLLHLPAKRADEMAVRQTLALVGQANQLLTEALVDPSIENQKYVSEEVEEETAGMTVGEVMRLRYEKAMAAIALVMQTV